MARQPDNAAPAGITAAKPTEVPPKGWKQILLRAFKEGGKDNISIMSGGIAYSVFAALVPTLSAIIFIYGLVVSPARAASQVERATESLPANARSVITELVNGIVKGNSGALGAGLVISILLALFSASGAVNNVITAVNVAYDEENNRNFLKKRLIAYGLTVGAIVFFIIVLAIVAGLPALLKAVQLGAFAGVVSQIGGIVLLALLFLGALAVLYRVAPDRDAPQLKWATPGALAAMVLWVLASAGIGVYVRLGSFGNAFGPFAGIIVLLFWLYWTAYMILLGAEINSEAELQTARDTTKGRELPLGERRARKADEVPPGTPAALAQAADGVDDEADEQDTAGSAGGGEAASGRLGTARPHDRRGAGMSQDLEPGSVRVSTPAANASTGELVKMLSEQMSTLVRSEFQLAQAEVKEKGKKLGVGAGLFGGAGFIALYALNALIATLIIVLDLWLPLWLAALIVTVVLFAVGGILALLGKKEVSEGAPPLPTEAIASTKQDVATVKEAAHR